MKNYLIFTWIFLILSACILEPDENTILGSWWLSELSVDINTTQSNRTYPASGSTPYLLRFTENYAYSIYTNISTGSNKTVANSYSLDKADKTVTFGTSVLGYKEWHYGFADSSGTKTMTLSYDEGTTNLITKWINFVE